MNTSVFTAGSINRKAQAKTMSRIVLTAYMLLLSLSGPIPCCCTFARFVGTVMSLGAASEQAGFEALECCKGQFASVAGSQRDDRHSDAGKSSPKRPTERCKCVKSVCYGVSVQRLEFVIDQSRLWLDDACLQLAAPWVREAGGLFTIVANFDGTPPVALTGRDIRVAHCSWHC